MCGVCVYFVQVEGSSLVGNLGLDAVGLGLGAGAKKGMDPTTLMMLIGGGSSLLGGLLGGDGYQERKTFTNAGIADPKRALTDALGAVRSFGAGLEARGPARLRSFVPPPAAPINVPGVGFQIGGGLGTDPALFDASILQGRQANGPSTPFQSLHQATTPLGGRSSSSGQSTGSKAKQRQPRSE